MVSEAIIVENGYEITCQRALEVLNDSDEGADPRAYDCCQALLSAANVLRTAPFPKGNVSTDDDGGMHVLWRNALRTVWLMIRPEKSRIDHLLYHDDHHTHGGLRNPTAAQLAEWLAWFHESISGAAA